MTELNRYIPEGQQQDSIEFNQDLGYIVDRLSEVFPPEKIWELFSSSPGETGGKIRFPFCRVDRNVINARNYIYLIADDPDSPEVEELYKVASTCALQAIAWVEIGFQGLEHLAVSPASRNWTSSVGHKVTSEERAQKIMTTGKELYNNNLRTVVDYRQKNDITDDCFSQYGVEYLLDTINPQES